MIRAISQKTGGRLAILGVGGILTAEDAWEKLAAGASAVEIYTGFVYGGPSAAGEMVRGLGRLLSERKVSALRAVIGSEGGASRRGV